MIYEMRTYSLVPGSLAEVEKRFGEAYQYRKKYSELAAFWHTEIGPRPVPQAVAPAMPAAPAIPAVVLPPAPAQLQVG